MLEEMRTPNIHLPRRTHHRLSGPDASFLAFERADRPMHIGAVAWFDSAPWRDHAGALDGVALAALLAGRAARVPALRLHLRKAPVTGWPYWLEQQFDPALNIRIADPVERDELVRDVAERELARPLDRRRPLWRLVIVPVEGGDRFALILCAHHALVDGIAGIDLLAQLFDGRHTDAPAPTHLTPLMGQHAPRLGRRELARWALLPMATLRRSAAVLSDAQRRSTVRRRGFALVRTCLRLLTPGPRHAVPAGKPGMRQVAWFDIEERPLRYARKRLRGTPNDLVLAAVSEAIHRLHGGHAPGLGKLRAAVPVSTRKLSERFEPGNRIGLMLSSLKADERNPGARVGAIGRATATQKRRGDYEGYEVLGEITAWTGQWSQRLLHWIARTTRSYGILVTNVPGPSRPYHLGGARLDAVYPLVPLFGGQSLSVAVIRYGAHYRVGVTTAWETAGLAEEFSRHLRSAFEQLARAVPAESPASVPAPASGRPLAADHAT